MQGLLSKSNFGKSEGEWSGRASTTSCSLTDVIRWCVWAAKPLVEEDGGGDLKEPQNTLMHDYMILAREESLYQSQFGKLLHVVIIYRRGSPPNPTFTPVLNQPLSAVTPKWGSGDPCELKISMEFEAQFLHGLFLKIFAIILRLKSQSLCNWN